MRFFFVHFNILRIFWILEIFEKGPGPLVSVRFKSMRNKWKIKYMDAMVNHHHNHSSSEDRFEGFFILDTTKCLFQANLFTAIFHISVASSTFSTGRRWDEICCLVVNDACSLTEPLLMDLDQYSRIYCVLQKKAI